METIGMESPWGNHINTACKNAIKLAQEKNCRVKFMFNGTEVIASATDTPEGLAADWNRRFKEAAEAHRNSPEYKAAEAQRVAMEKVKDEAHLIELAKTEDELREVKDPWPRNMRQLTEYIESLVKRDHDYGTCVYAMSLAATAAFNYVAHELGTTGFQASCADLDFLRRSRHINGPFILLKGEDALFPQYDLPGKLNEALEKWRPWLKEEATKRLAEDPNHVHPEVKAHWEALAK